MSSRKPYGSVGLVHLFMLFAVVIYITSSKDVQGLDDFNIGAAGDWSCKDDAKNTVTNIVDKNPEIVLGLGDYAYRNNATCWFEMVDPIKDKMKITLGNHDVLAYVNGTVIGPSPERIKQYMIPFNLSKQFYSFDYQNVHFIAMSSEEEYKNDSEQYDFVLKDLQSSSQNPDINWIIVYLHKGFYTSPNMGHSNTGPDTTALRDTYHQMFEQYGVDLVLHGHVHNYQRTFPIKYNIDDPSKPTITDSTPNHYLNPEGQIFATAGTAGINFHTLEGKSSFVAYQQDKFFGALDILVTSDGNRLVGKYFSNNGSKLDEFSIAKTDIGSRYNYSPSFSTNGSNYFDVPSSSALQLDQFSIAAWFKSSANFKNEAFIVNKGGIGNDTAGHNMNYQISMTNSEKIKAGFETSSGDEFFVLSPTTYNNSKWYHVVVTYDGSSNLILYINGVPVDSNSTAKTLPDSSGTQPVRIGANSLKTPSDRFFTGEVDEVRVWKDDLTPTQVSDAYEGTSFNTGEQVLHLDFKNATSSLSGGN